MMTTRRWLDWCTVILGLWLIASPRYFDLASGDHPAAWNSWSLGAALVTIAGFSMRRPAVWADAVGAVLGLWLIASPWLFQFANLLGPVMNAVVVGLLVIVYAVWAFRIDTAPMNAGHPFAA